MQVCAGQKAGSGTPLHALWDLYQNSEIEAVLLIDTDNAFNSVNSKVMLQNICITCPIITLFISNCYMKPARSICIKVQRNEIKKGDNMRQYIGTQQRQLTP